jgi:hypothetical protein
LRGHLESQIEDLDEKFSNYMAKSTIETIDDNDNDNDKEVYFQKKRQLKSQGIMERLRNKMEHDLNRYGWDKK